MVEGPGCMVKGEKIRSKLLKQTVTAVQGNAVDREEKDLRKKKRHESTTDGSTNCRHSSLQTSFHRLVGQPLNEVLTLGKELFMFFGNSCLRVHFLMAGSFRVNDQQVDTDGGRKIPASASLDIQFAEDKLTFYKTAAEIRPSSACYQKYANLKDLDICSPTFNLRRAVTEMMLDPERQLCDVLLDQDTLPGVGNIIKNEALFDSGLKPDSQIKDLTEEHILHLVKMTRDFSMVFYKCRKNGTNLRQYMKIYQKGKCGECETKIVMTRMGEDNERVTYFCPSCQTNDIKKRGVLKLPSRNSLLGWVQKDSDAAGDDWACSVCTLFNGRNRGNCSVCLTPRNSQSCSLTTSKLSKSVENAQISNAAGAKRKGTEAAVAAFNNDPKKLKLEDQRMRSSSCKVIQKKVEPEECFSQQDLRNKIPVCNGHGFKCVMRQTFKDNENKGRWFFTCAATPANKRCNFFQWADEDFPLCSGHGKTCALRTVMKQGPNNGKRFFCCPLKKVGCRFFEWADGYG